MKEVFMRFPEFKTKCLTLSFDDGTVHDREMVRILNGYKIKCTFNISSGLLGKNDKIGIDEINNLYENHEIAIHTYLHPHLENLDGASVINQILSDRILLENTTKRMIKGMAYPFGLSDKSVLKYVDACGIDYARTTKSTLDFSLPENFLEWNPTCHHTNPNLDRLICDFLAEDDTKHPWRITTKVLYIWGHSYEFQGKFSELEKLCEKISGDENVWYATNGEIFNYVNNYKRLIFSADGSVVFNPTLVDFFVYSNGKNKMIPSGKTVCLED